MHNFHVENNPLVSIIIPVYNGENFVIEAIESALNQTYENIEVIVVNDGSVDRTEELITPYLRRLKYIKKENGGVSSALNLGIKESQGEYVSWLSHDDIYYPEKIKKQINFLKNRRERGLVYSNYECVTERGDHFSFTNFELKTCQAGLADCYYPILTGMTNGCTMLIPRDILLQNPFRDDLKYTQDYDLWFRIFPKLKIFFLGEVVLKSRNHKNQDSKRHNSFIECDKLWINIIKKIPAFWWKSFFLTDYAFATFMKRRMVSASYIEAGDFLGRLAYCQRKKSEKDKHFCTNIRLIIKNINEDKKFDSCENLSILIKGTGNRRTYKLGKKVFEDLSLCLNNALETAKGTLISFSQDYNSCFDKESILEIQNITEPGVWFYNNKIPKNDGKIFNEPLAEGLFNVLISRKFLDKEKISFKNVSPKISLSLFFVLINCYPGFILGSNVNEVNSDILCKISFSRLNLRDKIQCLSFMQNDKKCQLYLNYFRGKFKLNDTYISRTKLTIPKRIVQILRIFLSDWLLIKLIIIKRHFVDSFKI